MAHYLCLQRSLPTPADTQRDSAGAAHAQPSPADMQAMYARFAAWQQEHADAIVDMGGKLGGGRLVTVPEAADGPFVEVKELVGGYMIVRADSLEGAIAVASACPGLVRPGSGVEVVEIHTP